MSLRCSPLPSDVAARLDAAATARLERAGREGSGAASGELALLQALLAESHDDDDLDAVAWLLGERLRRDLGLQWVRAADDQGEEPALRYRETDVVFFPRRMVRRQLAANRGSVDLAVLVDGTRDYLANLQRYALGERRARHHD